MNMKQIYSICRNRTKHFIRSAAVMIFAAVILSACSTTPQSEDSTTQVNNDKEAEAYSRDVFAMDTYMTLTAYGDRAEEAVDAGEKEIRRIEELVSTGIETSEVSRFNEQGEADISEDTEYLLDRSLELYRDTDGIFDITIYPVMKAWGFTDQNFRVPEEEELDALLTSVGADELTVSDGHVSAGKPGMQIDFGGIAKGYTSGRIMDLFRQNDIKHAVISLGGNVQTLNDKPDGSAWRVAVEDPKDTSVYIGIVEVKNKAVITSGGYERYFEEDGQTYHHIIDPASGCPANSGLTSVTIVSEDGTLADGLSTSLFIMGKEKATEYWRAHSDTFDMILVEEDGTVSVSEGISHAFSSDRDWKVIDN